MKREKRSIKIRAYNAFCLTVLLGAMVYSIFWSAEIASYALMTAAVVGVATPVVLTGDGFLEVIIGVFEALIEGVVAIIEGVVSIIASIFSF